MSFEKKAYEIAEMVRQTREYIDIQRAKKMINRKPELAKQLKQYLDAQKNIYDQRLTDEEVDRRMKVLQKDFDKLNQHQDIRHYMQALMRLNDKIYSINQMVYESLEEDLTL